MPKEAPDTFTVELSIRITYNLNGTPAADLVYLLDAIPQRLAGEGLLTGYSAAEVDEWSHRVTPISL